MTNEKEVHKKLTFINLSNKKQKNNKGKIELLNIDKPLNDGPGNSPVLLSCSEHGHLFEFDTPQIPKLTAVLRDSFKGCKKCNKNYNYSLEEYREIISKKLKENKSKHKLVDLVPDKDNPKKISLARVHFSCGLHGNTWEFDKPQKPTIQKLMANIYDSNTPVKCRKCNKNYNYSLKEYWEIISKELEESESKLKLVDLVLDKSKSTKNSLARVHFSCEHHGNTWEFNNPQAPTIQKVMASFNPSNTRPFVTCLKCSNSYEHTMEEMKQEMIELAEGTKFSFKGFTSSVHKGNMNQCIFHCEDHGDMSSWGNPTLSTVANIRKCGLSCTKCRNQYKQSTKEATDIATNFCKENGFVFMGFDSPNDEFKGANTKCKIKCSTCNDVWYDREIPVLPHFTQISNRGVISCGICNDKYIVGEKEATEIATNKLKLKGMRFIRWVSDKYYRDKTEAESECEECGDIAVRTFNAIKSGNAGCRPCAHKFHDLNSILKEIYSEDMNSTSTCVNRDRALYWIEFITPKKSTPFYKIGLAQPNDKNLTTRYKKSKLGDLSFNILGLVVVPNGIATLTETYILHKYKKDKYIARQLSLNDIGGTYESFNSNNLSSKDSLLMHVSEAVANIDSILDHVKVENDEKSKTKFKQLIKSLYDTFLMTL